MTCDSATAKLFDADFDHPHLNACRSEYSINFDEHANSYREVANYVTEGILRQELLLDASLPAVVFLNRHAIELKLKAAVLAARGASRLAQGETHHDLRKLWTTLQALLDDELTKDLSEEFEKVEKTLKAFQEKDPGVVFRYPYHTDGEPHVKGSELVSLRGFVLGIQVVYETLDKTLWWLNQRNSQCD